MNWPDQATVERAATEWERSYFNARECELVAPTNRELAAVRAALSVMPDPTADTVLLDQVREFCDSEARSMIATLNASEGDAKWAAGAADAHNAVLTFIAALLAGGGE